MSHERPELRIAWCEVVERGALVWIPVNSGVSGCHSFVVDGGLVIDSAPASLPSIYFAIPWDAGLFRMLLPDEEPPPILTNRLKERPHESSTSGVRCAIDSDVALGPTDGSC